MELSDEELKVKKEIDKLWAANAHIEYANRGYRLQVSLKPNSLLFVGINPSYSEKDTSTDSCYSFDEESGKIHKYFNKFQDISRKVNIQWAHIDLLFLRETDQKNVGKIIDDHPDFVYKQLMISKEIIENLQPKIIVTNNTLARRLLGFDKFEKNGKSENEWINFEFKFDDSIGTHRITYNEKLENTPIFFTSMLTGQRALDNGSYERLVWHIKFVLGKLDKR